VHRAEPLVPCPSCLEVEIPIAKLKKYKSPGCGDTPAEVVQTINKLNNSVWNKEEFPVQWKKSIIVPIQKKVIKL
jgi:hypothetical protein